MTNHDFSYYRPGFWQASLPLPWAVMLKIAFMSCPREVLKMSWSGVTDKQWEEIQDYLPVRKPFWLKNRRKGGRPRADNRRSFNGILWILWTGRPWLSLPREYGAPRTVYRRLEQWGLTGALERLWCAYLKNLEAGERSRWERCFLEGDGGNFWLEVMLGAARAEFGWTRQITRSEEPRQGLNARLAGPDTKKK